MPPVLPLMAVNSCPVLVVAGFMLPSGTMPIRTGAIGVWNFAKKTRCQ